MLNFTEEQMYWMSLQFAVPAEAKFIPERGFDSRLAFFLALFSMGLIAVMLSKLLSSLDKAHLLKSASTAVSRVKEEAMEIPKFHFSEEDLFKKLVRCGEISKYLNILRVELESLNDKNLDKIALLESALAICYGTDPEVKFFDGPRDVRDVFEELAFVCKAYRDALRYLENNSTVRLDIKLLCGLLNLQNMKLNAESIVSLVGSFSSKIRGTEYETKKKNLFAEMAVDIKDVVEGLIAEKKAFQNRFQSKMNKSFQRFFNEFRMPSQSIGR